MFADRLKNQPQLLTVIGLALGFIAILATVLITHQSQPNDLVIIYGDGSREIAVDVRGAVVSPGVYRLAGDARVGDAIAAAGGVTDGADLSLVNQARRLDDGEFLSIPIETPATPVDPAVAMASPSVAAPQSIAYRIDINRASQPDLESLPGIGPVIAERIIAYRTEHGPFATPEDLLKVDGISENLLADIHSLITVGP